MTETHVNNRSRLLLATLPIFLIVAVLVYFVALPKDEADQVNQVPGVSTTEILIGSTTPLSGHASYLEPSTHAEPLHGFKKLTQMAVSTAAKSGSFP